MQMSSCFVALYFFCSYGLLHVNAIVLLVVTVNSLSVVQLLEIAQVPDEHVRSSSFTTFILTPLFVSC